MRLPPRAYRVAHVLLTAYWRIFRPVTLGVRVMVLRGEEVLLIRHTYQPGWFMPGGGLKRGETLLEAGRRELREETGLRLEQLEVAGLFTARHQGKTDHVVLFRACTDADPNPDSPEIAECMWFPTAALPEGIHSGTRRRIQDLAVPGAPVEIGRW